MQEYADSGARLGWLIDPEARVIDVFRPDAPVERLVAPATISAGAVLPGSVLGPIWEPGL